MNSKIPDNYLTRIQAQLAGFTEMIIIFFFGNGTILMDPIGTGPEEAKWINEEKSSPSETSTVMHYVSNSSMPAKKEYPFYALKSFRIQIAALRDKKKQLIVLKKEQASYKEEVTEFTKSDNFSSLKKNYPFLISLIKLDIEDIKRKLNIIMGKTVSSDSEELKAINPFSLTVVEYYFLPIGAKQVSTSAPILVTFFDSTTNPDFLFEFENE